MSAISDGNSDKRLSNLRPFKPGQSGNPAGRPKGSANFSRTLRQSFEGRLDEEAARDLLTIAAEAKQPKDRIAAWRLILEYAYGKAPAYAAIEGQDPLGLDDVAGEIQAIADELRAKRAS